MLYYFLEPDVEPETPEDYGYIHEDNLPDLESLRDHVKGIMQAMYLTGDVAMMESCLDELCNELDLKINEGDPILEKKGERNMMTWYLGYQRATIDSMHGRV